MRLTDTSRRQATVTVIVVSFLVLLLLLGLTFAFAGLREAEETRVTSESQNGGQTGVTPTNRGSSTLDQPPEPDAIINSALAALIYGAPDDLTGAFNVLRQHELARSIYGWNPKFPSPFWGYNVPQPATFNPNMAAVQPFNGIGHVSPTIIGQKVLPAPVPLPDGMVNFSWVTDPNNPMVAALQGKMYDIDSNNGRDPRTGPPAPWTYNPATQANPLGDRYWAKNANYTYPDVNNLFLAAIDPTSGRVLAQSFDRSYLLTGTVPANAKPGLPVAVPNSFDPADTNSWTNAQGRYLMLRPRPVDHQWPPGSGKSYFPYPTRNADGTYGDVELLDGKAIRQLDAKWTDLDLPVGYWRGKAYKPLVAFLVLDQDGRINLNTAGNFYFPTGVPQTPANAVPGSNQGVGSWEVNPSRVMWYQPPPVNGVAQQPVQRTDEASQLTLFTPGFGGQARYGLSWIGSQPTPIWAPIKQYGVNIPAATQRYTLAIPSSPQLVGENMAPPGSGAHFYCGVDFNGRFGTGKYSDDDTKGHRTSYTWGPAFIGAPASPSNPPRPSANSRFDYGMFIPDPSNANNTPIYDERSDHPALFNPYLLRSRTNFDLTYAPNKVIPNRTFGVEELRYLNAKFNYGSNGASQLAMLAPSTLGNQLFRSDPANPRPNPRFVTTTLSNDFNLPGAGPGDISGFIYNAAQAGQPINQPTGSAAALNPANVAQATAGYDDSYRAKITSLLGPVDLNRKLTEYRANINQPLSPKNVGNYRRAIADRQLLAHDIFFRLCVVSGIMDPAADFAASVKAGDPTQRWLAQVAVNIVDFIDSDECITPFKWTYVTGGGTNDNLTNETKASLATFNTKVKNDWVFGFERPRVNINEAFVRIENDPDDPFPPDPNDGNKKKASRDYFLKMWLELHNPITPANPAEQFSGPEGYPDPNVPDDSFHGGYRASLKESFQLPAAQIGDNTSYRVLVYKVKDAQSGGPDPMTMRQVDNIAGLGTANPAANVQLLNILSFSKAKDGQNVVDDNGGKTVIQPNLESGNSYRDESFYLGGPASDQQGGQGKAKIPGAEANLTSKALDSTVKHDNSEYDTTQKKVKWSPSFVLQRLACPSLAPSSLNPYVTMDYWDGDPSGVSVRLKYDHDGNPGNAMNPGTDPNWNESSSWGRRQPYDGVIQYTKTQYYQQNPQGIQTTDIKHTLGRHNGRNQNTWPASTNATETLQLPFIPLAHYDRILMNPTELFHVIALKPHELTREFGVTFGGQPDQADYYLNTKRRLKYTVDWLDHQVAAGQPGSFLYRALDVLRAGNFQYGLGFGGKIAGKVNINTIFNEHVFRAICDAQDANRFTEGDVTTAWQALLKTRNAAGQTQIVAPVQGDKPFQGFISPVLDSTNNLRGLDRTLLHADMLWNQTNVNKSKENYKQGLASGGGHASAIQKYELLSKVANRFTTRSNCFAVYLTVGYFEVMNPGPYNESNRPVLGKELGTVDGTVTRHRFFSIVDRTNLSIEQPTSAQLVAPGMPVTVRQGQPPVYFSYEPNKPVPQPPSFAVGPSEDFIPGPVTVRVPAGGLDTTTVKGVTGVTGYYDGTTWTIVPGSTIVLDVGDKQETLTVAAPLTYDQSTSSAVIRFQQPISKSHARGAIMRLANPDPLQPISMPGNPGPQPGFNYKSPRYAPIVKYVEQMK